MLVGFLIMSVGQSGNMPAPDMVIRKSISFKKGEYSLPNTDETGNAAITILGDNITVDFSGATIRGTLATVEPDQRRGTAIRVKGKNVTIKNVRVHGYQNGLVA